MAPLIIEMQSIDARSHRYRRYEMWIYPEHNMMVTRWGRIGRSWQKLKREHYERMEELEKQLKRILNRRLKHHYQVCQLIGNGSETNPLRALIPEPTARDCQLSLF